MRSRARLGLAVAVGVCLVTGVVAGWAANATAAIPRGSVAEVMFETGTKGPIGDPGYAVVNGWWGHEGGPKTGTTYFSLNAANSQGVVTTASVAALHRLLSDGGSFDKLRVAFVPASSDGSTERPRVHAGEPAGEAFTWWTDMGMGSAVAGSRTANDSGTFVSTQQQWDKFWHAGRPVQAFDSRLVLHDISDNAVSATPEGTSIMNAWPAGTRISVVLYVSAGYNSELEPLVKVGPDGRALSAWLTLRTVAKPGDPVRTSAGYRVLTASPGEGSKLVNGLPPASAKFDPKPVSTPSRAASPSTTSPTTAGAPTSSGATTARSSSSSGHGAAFMWIWIVIGLVVIVGAVLLLRKVRPPFTLPSRRPHP
ncbi:MAG: hypothetical protein JWR52_32 [Marmoricola sp.]|nr:hypothetical protein [Marmoricola sp.]